MIQWNDANGQWTFPTIHHFQEDPHWLLKRDLACFYGYSSHPQDCDEVKYVTKFFFHSLAAILEAAKGTKWEDMKEYQAEKNASLEKQIKNLLTRIKTLYDKQNPTLDLRYVYKPP